MGINKLLFTGDIKNLPKLKIYLQPKYLKEKTNENKANRWNS